MSCTTVLVGKNASYDGSTIIARNEDSPSGEYNPKRFIVVKPEEQPKLYKSVISKVEIKLPDNPMRYTAMPNAIVDRGLWAACGVNELNVAMSATETITTNERVLGADPLVEYVPESGNKGDKDYVPEKVGGIGEEDLTTIILPYITSARDGVKRLGSLLEEFGTYEMNAIAFQDVKEIWWLETIGGHHWIAKKVPDDSYVIMPNQFGIDNFDLEDALGEQKNHMCSSDLREFISKNHLDLSFEGRINPRDAFGSHSDADHVYNTPRAWILQRFFNPTSNTWDGINADYRPDSNNIPWCRVPERKITIEDVKYTLSHHFQGTEYDPYSTYGDLSKKGMFRAIGVNRNSFLGVIQIRPYVPEEIRAVEWLALGSNVYNALVPFYVNINKTPEYLENTTAKVTTNNFYWTNRLIAAVADPHFGTCLPYIERYQLSVQSKGTYYINQYDDRFVNEKINKENVAQFCEKANEKIAEMLEKETSSVLNEVLYQSTNLMKNAFSRSDG